MKRNISSALTFYFKIIFPPVWIAFFGLWTITGLSVSEANAVPLGKFFPVVNLAVGLLLIFRFCLPLKKVSVDETTLYASNYLKEIMIPLTDISNVTENIFLRTVTIHLKSSSPFGDKIKFMPKVRIFAFLSSHPVVAELKELAKPAKFAR